jgi:hypothetical protein
MPSEIWIDGFLAACGLWILFGIVVFWAYQVGKTEKRPTEKEKQS